MPLILISVFLLCSNSLLADVSYSPGSVKPWSPSRVSIFGEQTDEQMEVDRRMNIGGTEKIKPRLTISREIKEKDVELFRELLVKAKTNAELLGIRGSFELIPVEVQLDSPGGSVSAAMSLGRLIRQERIGLVSVRNNGKCLSSCVFILGAGLLRTLSFAPETVGIHRPYLIELSSDMISSSS